MHYEMRDKNNTTESLMKKLSDHQKIKNLVVTKGSSGALIYNKNKNKFDFCKAYANNIVDRVGAGDAMLSIIALCLKSGLTNELALLISSLAAAQSTETIGNKESTNKIKILKVLEHLLK